MAKKLLLTFPPPPLRLPPLPPTLPFPMPVPLPPAPLLPTAPLPPLPLPLPPVPPPPALSDCRFFRCVLEAALVAEARAPGVEAFPRLFFGFFVDEGPTEDNSEEEEASEDKLDA